MARYDSPGFGEQLPGYSGNYDSWQTAEGTPPSYPVPEIPGTTATSALVTPTYSGYQNADRVTVTPDDSQVPAQTDLYQGSDVSALSPVPGDAQGYSGAGQGHAGHFKHPNAAS